MAIVERCLSNPATIVLRSISKLVWLEVVFDRRSGTTVEQFVKAFVCRSLLLVNGSCLGRESWKDIR